MKSLENKPLVMPLEFKVACAITKVEICEALQIFIDHVSIYDSVSREYSEGYTEATRIIYDYVNSTKRKKRLSPAFRECNDEATNCVLSLIKLLEEQGEIDQIRKLAIPAVSELFHSMKRFYAPSERIYLSEDSFVNLSMDFCILCEMHNCSPNEYLEYFMGNISMSDFDARQALKQVNENIPLALYMKIGKGFGMDHPRLIKFIEIDQDFYDRKDELRFELHSIRDLQERTAILRDFYLSYYIKLNPEN